MPSDRPTLSTWIWWPSPTGSSFDVSGANGSGREFKDLPASASGAMVAARLRRAPGKIPIDQAVVAGRSLGRGLSEDLLVQRRQRTGRIGIAGVARERKGLAAAAAEVDFPELAALAWLGHPGSATVTVEGFGVLPYPG